MGFDAQLRTLTTDDPDVFLKGWEGAARWFFTQAAKGTDISRALPALAEVFREATQIGALRAAAAAIAAHDLRTRDVRHLAALAAKAKYPTYLLEGLQDAAGAGLDPAPALGVLLDLFAAEEYRVSGMLIELVQKGTSLDSIVAAIAGHPKASIKLGRFLREAQSKKLAIESGLPALSAQLDKEGHRNEVATAFHWLVESGADLAAVAGTLEKHLRGTSKDTAEQLGYSLGYHYIARGEWKRLDAVVEAAPIAFRALCVHYLSRGLDGPEIVDRIAAGLLSPDDATRARASSALQEALPRRRRREASDAVVARLASAVDDGVAEYLHSTHATPERAKALLPRIARTTEAARRLVAAFEAGGPEVRACSICTRLPREKVWTYEHDRPPATKDLVTDGAVNRCPECGRRYTEDYESEWEDMQHYETWSFKRLTPPETLKVLKEWPDHDAMLARVRSELRHPAREVRQQAAFDLAAHHLAVDPAGLATLLAEGDEMVLLGTLMLLDRERTAPGDRLEAIRAALTSASASVREYAAWILARHYVERSDTDALHGLLATDDFPLLSATVQTIWGATQIGFDAEPFAERLKELRHHRAEAVGWRAQWTLQGLAKRKSSRDPIPTYLADLASSDRGTRNRAADDLRAVVRERPEVAQAIPLLAAMVGDPETAFHGVEALKSFAGAGIAIDAAVPALVKAAPTTRDVPWLLYTIRDKVDLTPHLGELAKLIVAGNDGCGIGLQILEKHAEAGRDVSPVVKRLVAFLDEAEAYEREKAATILAREHLRTRDVDGLRALLRHRRSEPVYSACHVLRDAGADLAPVLPDLLGLLDHSASIVRDYAADAVAAFASRARDVVLAAIDARPKSKGLAALRARIRAER